MDGTTRLVSLCVFLTALLAGDGAWAQFSYFSTSTTSTTSYTTAPSWSASETESTSALVSVSVPPPVQRSDIYDGCGDTADVDSVELSTPDPDDFLENEGETFLAGDELRIGLVVARCARVESFLYAGMELWDAYDPVEGSSVYVEQVDYRAEPGDRSRIELRVVFPNDGHGDRAHVEVGLFQPKTGARAVHGLDVNWVASIYTQEQGGNDNGGTALTITEEEIVNQMMAGLHQYYGRDGKVPIEPGSSWILRDLALDPCPAGQQPYQWKDCLTVDVIEGQGIRFFMEVDLEIEYFCNVNIRSGGTFAYQLSALGASINWIEDLSLDIHVPRKCKVLVLGGILTPIFVAAEEIAEALVYDNVRSQVQTMLAQNVNCSVGCDRADQPIYEKDRVVIPILGTFRNVVVDVPYRAESPDDPSWNHGFQMVADQQVLLIPGGKTEICSDSQTYGVCEPFAAGPAGLENWRVAEPSVPQPWEFQSWAWVYWPFRAGLRERMFLPDRDPTAIVAPDDPVGMLLVRVGSGPIRELNAPCRLVGRPLDSSAAVAVNDRPDRPGGTGERSVTVLFMAPELIADVPQCPIADPAAVASVPWSWGPASSGTTAGY